MTLRHRGAGGGCGLTMAETAFYQAETGEDIETKSLSWVEGFDNGDESSPPGLRGVPTEWGCKVDRELRTGPADLVENRGSYGRALLPYGEGVSQGEVHEIPHHPRGYAISGTLARIHL